MSKLKILAVIQARSGSKGIKDKNIYKINEHPLISYSIYSAKKCHLITDVVVSTDSIKYAKIAKRYGALVPFIRPKNISGDKTLSVTSLSYSVRKTEHILKKKYDFIIELPCVSPLRTHSDITKSIELLIKNPRADSVVSVVSTGEKHPTRLKKIINNYIHDICKEFPEKGQNSRRQDLTPESFIRNGAIYLMRRNTLIKKQSRVGKYILAYKMDEKKSINVDTKQDLENVKKIIQSGECENYPNLLLNNKIKKFLNKNKPLILVTCSLNFLPEIKKKLQNQFSLIYAENLNDIKIIKILKKEKIEGWICSPCPKYRINEKILKYSNTIKVIVTPSTGTNHIDLEYCKKNKIKCFSLKNSKIINNIKASSEYAFTLILSTIRHIPLATKLTTFGIWREKEGILRSREFSELTIGIIGFGRIGSNVAKYSKAIGFKIIAYDPFVKINLSYVEQVKNIKRLIKNSDIILLSIHLDNKTKNLFNEKYFSIMKKGSYFINVSRGEIVNENCLLKYLKNKTIKAAGVDVISNEQRVNIKNNILIKYAKHYDNLFITPHIAGLTYDSEKKAAIQSYNNLIKFFKS
jgi:phosphoglycerate dehydrogenase-like enzyme/CMP-N-acetylneuraminic acid synthetase